MRCRFWRSCFVAVALLQLPLLYRIFPHITSEAWGDLSSRPSVAEIIDAGGARQEPLSSDSFGRELRQELRLPVVNSTKRVGPVVEPFVWANLFPFLESQPPLSRTDLAREDPHSPASPVLTASPALPAAARPPGPATGKSGALDSGLHGGSLATCPAIGLALEDRGIFVVKDGRGKRDRFTTDGFFERLAFGEEFSKYKPRVLSQEPWVMVLDAFLTEKERSSLVLACGEFRRSSTAGGIAKSIRNSLQFSCHHKSPCWMRKGIATYVKKLAEVTGVSDRHFEGLTVLKYGKGDYYGRHHDTLNRPTVAHNEGADCYNSTGPRVMTFMSYLTSLEPGQGGATRFNELGPLDVEPLGGRLLLWSDTLGRSPMWPDKRTDHEALTVLGGTKITATVWVHQYDHAGSVDRGCCRR